MPLNIVQRWLGQARIETTAIYVGVIGEEERTLARVVWRRIEQAFPRSVKHNNGATARLEE